MGRYWRCYSAALLGSRYRSILSPTLQLRLPQEWPTSTPPVSCTAISHAATSWYETPAACGSTPWHATSSCVLWHQVDDTNGRVRVADFGFARVLRDGAADHITDSNVGPVKWWPPEALVARTHSKASDVCVCHNVGSRWCLGATYIVCVCVQLLVWLLRLRNGEWWEIPMGASVPLRSSHEGYWRRLSR